MSENKAFSIKNVSVSYDSKNEVIRNLNLDVEQGETFGLIGLNGVGKTTLIKSILGLRSYHQGTIHIGGIDQKKPEARKLYSYLPERFEPPWFLSGLEFLKFSAGLYGQSLNEEMATDFAEKLALDPGYLKKRVQTYSKGMRQKLGLISTLLSGCPILILDEPMSGLDPRARAYVKNALQDIRKEGRTIFLSSHILADLNEICDRVAVLTEGHIKFLGRPDELLKQGKSKNIEEAFLNILDSRASKVA